MLFYLLFLSLICFILWGNKLQQSKKNTLAIWCIWFVSAFRWDIGYDYFAYYQMIYPVLDDFSISRFEPINQLIFYLAYYLHIPSLAFFIYSTLITILISAGIMKRSHYIAFSLLIYVCLCYTFSFGVIRQALAVSIIFYSYRFLEEKRNKYFFLCLFIAGLCHYSAIVGIFVFWAYRKATVVSVLIVSMAVLIGQKAIFYLLQTYELYENYIDVLDEMPGGTYMLYFYILLFLGTCFLFYFKKKKAVDVDKRLFFITMFSFIFPFVVAGQLGPRMSMYFLVFYVYLIPDILKYYSPNFRFLIALMFCTYLLLEIYVDSKNPTRSAFSPYKFIFFIDEPTFRIR